jgi:hypothetical protein
MILVQQTEQTCPKVKDFRQIYTKVSIFEVYFFVISAVLRIRIWDPMPFLPLDPRSGRGKNQDPDPVGTTRIIFLISRA